MGNIRYKVHIYTPQELNHSSYVQTGLFELDAEGFIQAKVVLSLNQRRGLIKLEQGKRIETQQPHPKTSLYRLIDNQTGKHINFATDLYDASFSFSLFALEHCDFIFKRNFNTTHIGNLPKTYQHKIHPLGMTFGVHSKFQKGKLNFFIGLFVTNLLLAIKPDRLLFKRIYISIRAQVEHWLFINTTRLLDTFESYTKISKIGNKILFQTRCFPNEIDEDPYQIHQQRQRIINRLRNEFGTQFIGGIIPSHVALQNYSDVISDLPSDPVSYINIVKETKYVIYTRGLVQSPAWKLAEYLSQGKVIIAEKLTAELPVPLVHGKEVLFFENESEIPDLIKMVMNDEALANTLSINARAYFEQYVHPKQNMKRILNFLIERMEHA